MRDQYIFDIPVYRSTRDEFDKETGLYAATRFKWLASYDPQRRPPTRKMQERELHSVIADSGGPWQLNQIVGWLRLFVEGSTIGCHLWWVDAKRLNRRMRKKRLYLTTSATSSARGSLTKAQVKYLIHCLNGCPTWRQNDPT
jgi:hypothetical protein